MQRSLLVCTVSTGAAEAEEAVSRCNYFAVSAACTACEAATGDAEKAEAETQAAAASDACGEALVRAEGAPL